MATTANLNVNLQTTHTNPLDLVTGSAPINYNFTKALANGTGVADVISKIFSDQRSVATATPDDLDLAGGLTDAFGATLTFTIIRGIVIRNRSTTVGEILTIGGDANAFVNWVGAATHTVKIGPGGILALLTPSAAGYAVTATTGDILQVAADAGTITYDIILLGE